jgi:arylsulfatase A-like enzyme
MSAFPRRTLRTASATIGSLLMVFVLLAGCDSSPSDEDGSLAETETRKPNVLLVVLDACRPDRMGCYGYERETTPALDAISREPETVLFRNHYVQAAFTKASTASLFTGLFVFQHGVIWGHEMKERANRPRWFDTQSLDDRFDTLAETFQDLGYYTFGVVKSHHLDPQFGFSQGFDDYHTPRDIKSDRERVQKTLEIVRSVESPFFGYVHLFGCHNPFPRSNRHAGFMERYGFDYDEEARIQAGVDFTGPDVKDLINDGELRLEARDVRFLDLIYDAVVRTIDEEMVAPLVQGLKESDVYDDTLLIVTADHGEELYDHEGYAHGHALWDEVIHVPMLAKFPKHRKPDSLAKEVSSLTQSIDLMPSLLSVAGAPANEKLPGTDIFNGAPRGFVFSQTKRGWTLLQGDYKLIEDRGLTFLSNREQDPQERENLAEKDPDRLAAMRTVVATLQKHVAIGASEAPVVETELDEEAVEALRALGYIR